MKFSWCLSLSLCSVAKVEVTFTIVVAKSGTFVGIISIALQWLSSLVPNSWTTLLNLLSTTVALLGNDWIVLLWLSSLDPTSCTILSSLVSTFSSLRLNSLWLLTAFTDAWIVTGTSLTYRGKLYYNTWSKWHQ